MPLHEVGENAAGFVGVDAGVDRRRHHHERASRRRWRGRNGARNGSVRVVTVVGDAGAVSVFALTRPRPGEVLRPSATTPASSSRRRERAAVRWPRWPGRSRTRGRSRRSAGCPAPGAGTVSATGARSTLTPARRSWPPQRGGLRAQRRGDPLPWLERGRDRAEAGAGEHLHRAALLVGADQQRDAGVPGRGGPGLQLGGQVRGRRGAGRAAAGEDHAADVEGADLLQRGRARPAGRHADHEQLADALLQGQSGQHAGRGVGGARGRARKDRDSDGDGDGDRRRGDCRHDAGTHAGDATSCRYPRYALGIGSTAMTDEPRGCRWTAPPMPVTWADCPPTTAPGPSRTGCSAPTTSRA